MSLSYIYLPRSVPIPYNVEDFSDKHQDTRIVTQMDMGTHTRKGGDPIIMEIEFSMIMNKNQMDSWLQFFSVALYRNFFSPFPDIHWPGVDPALCYSFTFNKVDGQTQKIGWETYQQPVSWRWNFREPGRIHGAQ